MSSEIIELRFSLMDFKKHNERLIKENQNLKNCISGLKRGREELINQKVDKKVKVIEKGFEKRIAKKEKEIEKKNKEIDEKDKQIEDLKAELAKLKSKCDR